MSGRSDAHTLGGEFWRESIPSQAEIRKTSAPCHVISDVRPLLRARRRTGQYADGLNRGAEGLLLEREHTKDLVAGGGARDQILHFWRDVVLNRDRLLKIS